MNIKGRNVRVVWIILLGLVAAAGLKAWLIYFQLTPFNADEAIVALMARHINLGETPAFFYGQAYMGSLDALLVAGGFRVFGQTVWVIRLIQTLIYVGVVGTTIWLGYIAYESWDVGGLAGLFLAIPTVNMTLYTTVSLGGYGEALLIGNLILICGLKITKEINEDKLAGSYVLWLILGILMGLGLWGFGLSLVYSIPIGILLLVKLLTPLIRKKGFVSNRSVGLESSPGKSTYLQRLGLVLGMFILGIFIGALPWWVYAYKNGFGQLLWELQGGAIHGVENLPWIKMVGRHLLNFILLGGTVILGMRPPWSVTWLGMPLLPLVFIFWMAVLVYMIRKLKAEKSKWETNWTLAGVIIVLVVAFIITSFGADPSGRYFLPIYIPLALFASRMVLDIRNKVGVWAYALVGLVLVFNLWGIVQSVITFPPGITTQFYSHAQVDHRYMDELIDFLEENGETSGYTNYWVSYPLAFLSNEELIFVPRLPYHPDFRYTERDDRYDPYGERVRYASKVAYITTNHDELEEYLRQRFTELDVGWEEITIGDYQVFYALSDIVRPEEIGLGKTMSIGGP